MEISQFEIWICKYITELSTITSLQQNLCDQFSVSLLLVSYFFSQISMMFIKGWTLPSFSQNPRSATFVFFFSHALFYMHVVIPFMLPTSITHSGGVLCCFYCCIFVFHTACSTCLGYTVGERRELVEIQSNKPSPSADNLWYFESQESTHSKYLFHMSIPKPKVTWTRRHTRYLSFLVRHHII